MDIMLERILSLIPTKENGDFVHGEKKKFAEKIGLKSGNVISDWIMGRSSSYANYIYKISAVYGVSVEWLNGESEQKEKPTGKADGRRIQDVVQEALKELSTKDLAGLIAMCSEEMGRRQ